jgi:hypothetical protein
MPRSRSRQPVGQRLPTAACPRKSGSNSSQRPVIYRPHPHQKHAGLLEFRAPSRPYPQRGQDDPVLGHCLGRNAQQRVRPEGGGRSSTKPYISPRGWCQGLVVRGAGGRWLLAGVPSRRGPARQPGDRHRPKLFGRFSNSDKFRIPPDRDDP